MLHGSRTLTINNRPSNLACRLLLTVRGKLENCRLLIRRERSPHLREAAVACSCTLLRGCTLQMALALCTKLQRLNPTPKRSSAGDRSVRYCHLRRGF